MYTFSLQKVLDYRKKQEELAQRRLAGALREREQARLVVEQVQDALSRCQEEYTGLQSPELDLPRLYGRDWRWAVSPQTQPPPAGVKGKRSPRQEQQDGKGNGTERFSSLREKEPEYLQGAQGTTARMSWCTVFSTHR